MEDTFKEKIEFLNYNIKIQKKLKMIILQYIQSFVNLNDIRDMESANDVINFLNELKTSISLCNENIDKLNFLFNNSGTEFETLKIVMENTLKIEDSIYAISEKSELKSLASTVAQEIKQELIKEDIEIQPKEKQKRESEELVQNNINKNVVYEENTLIISETRGKVILPYKLSDLKKILENKPDKYYSLDDVINDKYTLPIANYKNPFISRFKEAYKLMRDKEKSPIVDAIDLGLELSFNSLLNPAIITACKNLDELDIFLDCLDSNELDKFDIFNIKYEILPKK